MFLGQFVINSQVERLQLDDKTAIAGLVKTGESLGKAPG